MSFVPAENKEQFIVVQKNYTGTFADVAAGTSVSYHIDVTASGYRPIGILGQGYAQLGTTSFVLESMYIDTATLTSGTVKLKNVSSAAAKPYMVYLVVCYVKV